MSVKNSDPWILQAFSLSTRIIHCVNLVHVWYIGGVRGASTLGTCIFGIGSSFLQIKWIRNCPYVAFKSIAVNVFTCASLLKTNLLWNQNSLPLSCLRGWDIAIIPLTHTETNGIIDVWPVIASSSCVLLTIISGHEKRRKYEDIVTWLCWSSLFLFLIFDMTKIYDLKRNIWSSRHSHSLARDPYMYN